MSQKKYYLLAGVLIVIIICLVGYWVMSQPKTETAINSSKSSAAVAEDKNVPVENSADTVASEDLSAGNQLTDNVMELKIETLTPGQGAPIAAGQTAVVHYTGWLTDGTKFDSSVDRGVPFEFIVGAGMVIPGWDQGVAGMKVGEKCRLTIPSDLAYGDVGIPGAIPAKATLVFEVELLGIK